MITHELNVIQTTLAKHKTTTKAANHPINAQVTWGGTEPTTFRSPQRVDLKEADNLGVSTGLGPITHFRICCCQFNIPGPRASRRSGDRGINRPIRRQFISADSLTGSE